MLWELRKRAAEWLVNPLGRAPRSSPAPAPPLYGDRAIEWSWIAAKMPNGPGFALDVGSGGSSLALTAAMKGFSVDALDLVPPTLPYVHASIRPVSGDVLRRPFADRSLDLVINCSVMEHVGLAGRYGVTSDDEDGDLVAMRRLSGWTKEDGIMLMTIPVGRDKVVPPLHRIYGPQRMLQLFDRWSIVEEQYWAKVQSGTWEQVTRATAVETRGGADFYALGLFVLRPQH